MADAKDILGLTGNKALLAEKRRPPKETPKKPDGVSREVYALTGGLPPVMPTVDILAAKKRPPATTKKISWQWLPFSSSARTDNLQLYHWVKVVDGVPPTEDYFFAKFNKSADIIQYTDEEYSKYLTDPKWSREETDRLFDLCEQFDLRFIIIADRFDPPRSVEDLKNRYYSAAKTILMARSSSPEDAADHSLVKDCYNMAYEVERKRALGNLLSQSRQQDREDAEVLAEAKRISEVRLAAKVTEESETSVPVVSTVADVDFVETNTPARPGSPSPAHPSRPSIVPTVCATSTPQPAVTPTGPRVPRVYLRSVLLTQMINSVMPASGGRLIKRVEQQLETLGVKCKPKYPTKAVCAEHLELRKEILLLLNLKKQVRDLETAAFRDNPYADIPPTPSTPKKSHRANDQDRFIRTGHVGGDGDSMLGERSGKREHKRKAPARFTEAPSSPPQNKRARKLKASDG